MTASARVIALIESFEGFRLTAYQDGAGVWTIGYGTTHYDEGEPVCAGDTCTQDQAQEWLASDVASAVASVSRCLAIPINQNQFDALVSFTYNLGSRSLRESTLLKLLNAGCFELAAQEFVKWDHVAGKPSAGLLKRRDAERDLFLEPEA